METSKMKFYDCAVAPNPRRARIFIAEKGLDIPKVEVDIIGGENLKDEFLSVNPRGLLPVLELDDGTRFDEGVISSTSAVPIFPFIWPAFNVSPS
jgi:glutathione S-transferase